MKSSIITAAMALSLIAAPVAEVAAMTSTTVNEALMPTKKTTKKSTTKKTTTKKSSSSKTSSKKTSSTKAATTTATTKAATVATATQNLTESESGSILDAVSQVVNGTTSSSSKTSTGSSILGGIVSAIGGGSSSSSSTAGNILSGLSSIFNSSKVASKDQLVGTWTYTEPAVVFSSDNALKNIGGKVASSTIEKQLQSKFEKYGIKKGTMKMTFDKDGNFTQTVGSKTVSGTYTISGKSVTLKYAGGVQQFIGTTQLDGNDLLIVMDASKLLKYANTIGSLTGNSILSSAGSLISSMNGMEVGLKLNK